MCLGIPMRVIALKKGFLAEAETLGVKREISVLLVPGIKPGDHVLVHAGFAMQVIEAFEASERMTLFEKILGESI